jgi:hypothetical protein
MPRRPVTRERHPYVQPCRLSFPPFLGAPSGLRATGTSPLRLCSAPALLLRSAERTLRVPLAREPCRSAPFFGQPAVGFLAPLDSGFCATLPALEGVNLLGLRRQECGELGHPFFQFGAAHPGGADGPPEAGDAGGDAQSFADAGGDFWSSVAVEERGGQVGPVVRWTTAADVLQEHEDVVGVTVVAAKVAQMADFKIDEARATGFVIVENVP